MSDTKFIAVVNVQNYAVKGALAALAGFDFSPGFELDRRLKADQTTGTEHFKK